MPGGGGATAGLVGVGSSGPTLSESDWPRLGSAEGAVEGGAGSAEATAEMDVGYPVGGGVTSGLSIDSSDNVALTEQLNKVNEADPANNEQQLSDILQEANNTLHGEC